MYNPEKKKMKINVRGGRVFITDPDNMVRELPAQYLHDFWRNPERHNHRITTEDYRGDADRSEKLVEIFNKYCSKDSRILELGCNVGRNLHHLYNAGFKNLTGLDICQNALNLGKEFYPDTVAKIPLICSTIEDYLVTTQKNSFDVVFTMTVLMHLHPSSVWIFNKLPQITTKQLIVVEEEGIMSETVFPYQFKEMFELFGMKQVHEEYLSYENKIDDTGELRIQYRVFNK